MPLASVKHGESMRIDEKQIIIQNQTASVRKNEDDNSLFKEKLMSAKSCNKQKDISRDEYTKSNCSVFQTYNNYSNRITDIEFPMETDGYKIEQSEQFEGVPAYILTDKMTGKSFYIREDKLEIQKDEKSGNEFIINMDQPYSYNIRVTDEFKSLLQDLSDKRGFDLNEVPMKENLIVKRDNKSGLEYLTTEGREWAGCSVIIKSQADIDKLDKLTNEFAAHPVGSDFHVANLYALLEIAGTLRRGNEGLVYFTDKWITYASYDGDKSKSWEIEMSEGYSKKAGEILYSDFDFSNPNEWIDHLKNGNISDDHLQIWDYYSMEKYAYGYKKN